MKWIMPLPFLILLAMLTLSPYSAVQREINGSIQMCSAELTQALNYNFEQLGSEQRINLCEAMAES